MLGINNEIHVGTDHKQTDYSQLEFLIYHWKAFQTEKRVHLIQTHYHFFIDFETVITRWNLAGRLTVGLRRW